MELEYVSLIYVSLISEIFRLFVNTLTAGGNYSLRNSENLRQPIQKKSIFLVTFEILKC